MNQKYKNIIKAVEKSGEIVLSYFGKSLKTQQKSCSLDFFTDADVKSESNLINAIEKEFPDYNIQSEEKGYINKKSSYTFIIDPLDGTLNLFHGIPYFSVTLALLKEDEAIFAVTHNPVVKQTYYAEKGRGAFLNNKKITVSKESDIDRISAGYTCGWQVPRSYVRDFMNKLYSLNIYRVMTNWSPALDFCLVASGKIEVMICYQNELHDVIAGRLLIREAGGKITDLKGRPLKNDRVNTFLATNGTKIHERIVKVL